MMMCSDKGCREAIWEYDYSTIIRLYQYRNKLVL